MAWTTAESHSFLPLHLKILQAFLPHLCIEGPKLVSPGLLAQDNIFWHELSAQAGLGAQGDGCSAWPMQDHAGGSLIANQPSASSALCLMVTLPHKVWVQLSSPPHPPQSLGSWSWCLAVG